MALYNATGGDEWLEKGNWLSDKVLEEWYGVDTDGQGRVVQLELHSNNLQGELPKDLWELTELEELALSNNPGLTGPLPPEVGNLVNLRTLNLDGNSGLSGELPAEVGQLVKLGSPSVGGYRSSYHLGIRESGLCVPPGLEETLRSRLSVGGRTYGGVLCRERELLEGIYEALGGDEWLEKGNWLSDKVLEEWYGVDTDGQGRVVQLELHSNNLQGELPKELWELTELTELALSNNPGLTGCIPTAVQVRLGSNARPFGSQASGSDPFCVAGSVPVARPGATPTPSRHPDNNIDDLQALEALYEDTGSSDWTNNTNWP